jgi:hypothetical protein
MRSSEQASAVAKHVIEASCQQRRSRAPDVGGGAGRLMWAKEQGVGGAHRH